jgi:hypothetical protein
MSIQAGCFRALAIVACAIAAAASTEARAAGGAYQVDTAEVSEPGSCKVESWVSSASNRDLIASVAPSCVVNLGRPVELSAQFSRTRARTADDDYEWGTAANPKFKTNIVPSAIGSWGFALTAIASYDLLTKENTALSVTIPGVERGAGQSQRRLAARPHHEP